MSDETVSDITSHTMDAVIDDGHNTFTLTSVIEYRQDKTPVIDSLSQQTGSIYGSETLTMTGTNLDIGVASVLIDQIECVINTGATTSTNL